MDKADIPFLSVTQLSDLIKDRTVSPVEAVEAYLDRIDSLNSKLYAYLTICRDEALQAARQSEQALDRGEYLGPMHGIPVAVKDQINTAGIRTTTCHDLRCLRSPSILRPGRHGVLREGRGWIFHR